MGECTTKTCVVCRYPSYPVPVEQDPTTVICGACIEIGEDPDAKESKYQWVRMIEERYRLIKVVDYVFAEFAVDDDE
jgi:hypothetical protein